MVKKGFRKSGEQLREFVNKFEKQSSGYKRNHLFLLGFYTAIEKNLTVYINKDQLSGKIVV